MNQANNSKSLFDYLLCNNKLYENENIFDWNNIKISNRLNDYLNDEKRENDILFDSVRFLSYSQICIENTEMAPGAILSAFGFLVIAITTGGNAIAINLNPNTNIDMYAIVYADHSVLCDKTYFGRMNGVFSDHIISENNIKCLIYETSETFDSFLDKIQSNSINLEEIDFIL